MEEELPELINTELLKILMSTKEAQLIILGYTKGANPNIRMKAEFTLIYPEDIKQA